MSDSAFLKLFYGMRKEVSLRDALKDKEPTYNSLIGIKKRKSRRRVELLELCKNAAEIKVPKTKEESTKRDELINSKITLPGGKLLPYPLSLKDWTHDFTGVPDFRFPDIYHYLVGKDGYDEDCLRSYKSLEGFRLFVDGHVEDLNYHDLSDDETGKKDGYCYFQFKVKPTERSKTEDGKDFYWGFIVLQYTGSIYSAYCACKGG
ncbi:uncharacterized protein LOC111319076 [Stylophora pistillata]|uniref:uncharacterized protein LOC111319076 n=1 Tax=Stylophora pistillata TaxID=50429 RepID=UPI000C04F2A2|nr:uncharacterized protein LOC111319076 [Stylophora pistillata]